MDTRLRHDYRHYDKVIPPGDAAKEHPSPQSFVELGIELDNEIHPLFRRVNFPGANYEALRPALQLATLFIDTDCLLPFWHAMFFGELRRVSEGVADETRWHWANFRPRQQLSARDRAATRFKLLTLSHMFKFYRLPKGVDADGRTELTGSQNLSTPYDLGTFQGTVQSIRYSENMYATVSGSFDQIAQSPADESALFNFRRQPFHLAVTIAHEVAHAAAHAQDGEAAATFEYNTMTEGKCDVRHTCSQIMVLALRNLLTIATLLLADGFNWEHFTFGGLINICPSVDFLVEWPSASTDKLYGNGGGLWKQRGCGDIEARWYVPEDFINSVFTIAFWAKRIASEGASALKVPKQRGARVETDDDGDLFYFQPSEQDIRHFDGIPDGWYADDQGYLFPIDKNAAIDPDGFGRLMRINIKAIEAHDQEACRQQGEDAQASTNEDQEEKSFSDSEGKNRFVEWAALFQHFLAEGAWMPRPLFLRGEADAEDESAEDSASTSAFDWTGDFLLM